MKFLHLIRYKNLLLIALMQLVCYFGFLKLQPTLLAINNWQYILLIVATLFIAAGGYIINAIFDQGTDAINKPNKNPIGNTISESKAYNFYTAFTLIGVLTGYYLSHVIKHPNFVIVFILCASLLYLYATDLKQIVLIKNIIVSLLLAFSVIIIGLFTLFPVLPMGDKGHLLFLFSVLIDFSIIAFMINFLREIIKDIEDIKGDYNEDIRTLPIILGTNRTLKLVFGLTFIPITLILSYVYINLFELLYATLYILFFIIGPLIYFAIKVWNAQSQKDYKHLSNVLKLIILLGSLSIGIIGLNMNFYATH
ncbi:MULTISPECIES: geranylgeranylglycerol-phosphate geranylgeranyltransferase [Flavobacterium]|uniref:Prenyltransferase n=1 Tax=Flavobacterium columnare TaxID=996 RepID=A0AA94F018_9FLAO|nr:MULTISPECIES: geranylgeranylglycerol-phosphate geranylgeranyltransferase [Flavobacterium]MCH4830372.1 geranylgeranylglycerol-phosphate geranylgeranyltransferase [Flavobacterium columnare]MCH4833691.1 geranylgeranylglycerol-phosphate geranylgeranyltransferase [Flavobacterium columnare]QYS91270.1 geranylgeranylglycerol-phosphate geranylgeranyltransferase [Flavobacterium covae]